MHDLYVFIMGQSGDCSWGGIILLYSDSDLSSLDFVPRLKREKRLIVILQMN